MLLQKKRKKERKRKVALVVEALCCSGNPNRGKYFSDPDIESKNN